jgi:hypothetical protein
MHKAKFLLYAAINVFLLSLFFLFFVLEELSEGHFAYFQALLEINDWVIGDPCFSILCPKLYLACGVRSCVILLIDDDRWCVLLVELLDTVGLQSNLRRFMNQPHVAFALHSLRRRFVSVQLSLGQSRHAERLLAIFAACTRLRNALLRGGLGGRRLYFFDHLDLPLHRLQTLLDWQVGLLAAAPVDAGHGWRNISVLGLVIILLEMLTSVFCLAQNYGCASSAHVFSELLELCVVRIVGVVFLRELPHCVSFIWHVTFILSVFGLVPESFFFLHRFQEVLIRYHLSLDNVNIVIDVVKLLDKGLLCLFSPFALHLNLLSLLCL